MGNWRPEIYFREAIEAIEHSIKRFTHILSQVFRRFRPFSWGILSKIQNDLQNPLHKPKMTSKTRSTNPAQRSPKTLAEIWYENGNQII